VEPSNGVNNLAEEKIIIKSNAIFILCGPQDKNLKFLETQFHTNIIARGTDIIISGAKKNVTRTKNFIEMILKKVNKTHQLTEADLKYAAVEDNNPQMNFNEGVEVLSKKRYVKAKTVGQKKYIEAIKNNDIVFAIGPAGTGKTYLAMAMAVSALKKKEVSRIILARPAIETGEKLGFLPGNIFDKVSPYLRPLYDALYDMVEFEKVKEFTDKGIIEIAPLAFMRGRTLNDAFIILDEAQNTTPEQMKMFLTRLGFGSKAVITGDITQVDLPEKKPSGLIQIQSMLKNTPGITFFYLTSHDVVRHKLVQQIIEAYGKLK
jgi:phosphate starvation-inducible PhoH-like protein